MTARLLTAHGPDRLVACWDDDWRPAFRVDALPSYKAHRLAPDGSEEIVPDELTPQVPILIEVLAGAGIDRVGAPGYEADDIIGTLATRARGPVDVVTGDRDLFQLVDDARGSGCSTPRAASATSRRSTRRPSRPSTASPAGRTPTSPSCAGTRATGCPGSPGSARRRRPP